MVRMASTTIKRSPRSSTLCRRCCREVHQHYVSNEDEDDRIINGCWNRWTDQFPERFRKRAYNYWHHRNSRNSQTYHGAPSRAQWPDKKKFNYVSGRSHPSNRFVDASSSKRPKTPIKKRQTKYHLSSYTKKVIRKFWHWVSRVGNTTIMSSTQRLDWVERSLLRLPLLDGAQVSSMKTNTHLRRHHGECTPELWRSHMILLGSSGLLEGRYQ